MVSREGGLKTKWYMVSSEKMLISDNMKPDMMVLGNEDPPHIWTHISHVQLHDYIGESQLSQSMIFFQGEISHSAFLLMT
jgi:hypothetical protein